jgi:hypothetical protein
MKFLNAGQAGYGFTTLHVDDAEAFMGGYVGPDTVDYDGEEDGISFMIEEAGSFTSSVVLNQEQIKALIRHLQTKIGTEEAETFASLLVLNKEQIKTLIQHLQTKIGTEDWYNTPYPVVPLITP